MRRTPGLTIIRGLPGHDTVRQVTLRFAQTQSSVLTSSDPAVLTQARDILEKNAGGLAKYMDSVIEIKPLGELVRIFCDFTETPVLPVANRERQSALMAGVAAIIDERSPIHNAKDLPGFHEALADVFQLLRWYRIKPEMLNGLGGHVSEVAKLWLPFESALAEYRLTTLSHRIEAIVSATPAKPRALRSVFWIGETEWRPLAIEFVKWMLRAGTEVFVVVERHPTDETFYAAFRQLSRAFPEATVQTLEQTPLPQASLFGPKPIGRDADVLAFEAADEVCEVEWAIRSADLTRQQNTDARVCIFCRNLDDYGPLLSFAAKRVGLSLSVARTEPLYDNRFARLCAEVVAACAGNSLIDVASLALSSYSAIPIHDRQEVANATRQLSKSEDPWSALAQTAGDPGTIIPAWFEHIARWREQALRAELPLAEWIRRFKRLISVGPWLDEATKSSTGESSERDQAAQDAIIRGLETSRLRIPPGINMTLDKFLSHLMAVLRDSTYWVRSKGDIRVASTASEISDATHLFVIGLVEGKFPKRRAEDPILLDDQALRLQQMGFPLPTSFERAEEERLMFHRIISAVPHVYLSWPQTFSEQVEIPSSFLIELESQLPTLQKQSQRLDMRFPRYDHALRLTDALTSLEWYRAELGDERTEQLLEAMAPSVRSIRQKMASAIANSESETFSDVLIKTELSRLPRPLHLRHLRALKRCPFQYFAAARLSLNPRRAPHVWDRLARIVRRTDLVSAADEQELLERLLRSLSEEIAESRGQATEDELEFIAITAPRVLQAFAKREFEARQKWNAQPIAQNKRLHETPLRHQMPYDGDEVVLDERIDILYKRNDDYLPIRLGYVSDSDEDFEFEAGMLFILAAPAKLERMAGLDSLERQRRRVLVRTRSGHMSSLISDSVANIWVSKRSEPAHELDVRIKNQLQSLVAQAKKGDFRPTPGEHCSRCGYASLCRKSAYARPFHTISQRWDEENS